MSVPKLDLAPKLKRPLSLWNPLDYLRLLYWSIFFPQAFTWYLKNWGGGDIAPTLMNIPKRWQLRLHYPNRRNLLIQELILIVFCALISYGLSVLLNSNQNQNEFTLFVLIGSSTFGLLLNLIWNIGLGITGTLAYGVAYGVAFDVAYGVAYGVAGCVPLGV